MLNTIIGNQYKIYIGTILLKTSRYVHILYFI